jgi:hypothetical protein
MRLRQSYTLGLMAGLPEGFQLPFTLEIGEMRFEIPDRSETRDDVLSAYVESNVNPANLAVRTGPQPLSGGDPQRAIHCPEESDLSAYAHVIATLLSFLTDIPIRLSHKLGGDSLIAESDEDIEALQGLGTNQVFDSLHGIPSLRSFSLPTISYESIKKMIGKEVGLALYSQALQMSNPVGTFREYWKVLESAFGRKDDELIELISKYDPAIQLGFDKEELRVLHVLRGRASHAESSAGIAEYRHVKRETSSKLARLKGLVEQVLVTKKTWGIPTVETDRIARLQGFIDSEGSIVLLRKPDD